MSYKYLHFLVFFSTDLPICFFPKLPYPLSSKLFPSMLLTNQSSHSFLPMSLWIFLLQATSPSTSSGCPGVARSTASFSVTPECNSGPFVACTYSSSHYLWNTLCLSLPLSALHTGPPGGPQVCIKGACSQQWWCMREVALPTSCLEPSVPLRVQP